MSDEAKDFAAMKAREAQRAREEIDKFIVMLVSLTADVGSDLQHDIYTLSQLPRWRFIQRSTCQGKVEYGQNRIRRVNATIDMAREVRLKIGKHSDPGVIRQIRALNPTKRDFWLGDFSVYPQKYQDLLDQVVRYLEGDY